MGQPVFYFLRIFLLNEWLNKISPSPLTGEGVGGGELKIER